MVAAVEALGAGVTRDKCRTGRGDLDGDAG